MNPFTVENRKNENYSIGWFQQRIQRGKINPAPVYQRSFLREFDDKFKVRLVESVLCECPIPSLYLCSTGDANYDVLDGQQRIRTLVSFMNNGFSINKKYLDPSKWEDGSHKEMHKIFFKDMDDTLQNRFEDYQLKCDIFTETDEWMARDIYIRINAASSNLKPMELMKATYSSHPHWGTINDFAESEEWMKICNKRSNMRLECLEMLVYHLVYADPAWAGSYANEDTGRSKSNQIALKLDLIMKDDYQINESLSNVKKWMRWVVDIYGDKPFAMKNLKLSNLQESPGGRMTKSWVTTFYTLFSNVIPHMINTYAGRDLMSARETIKEHFIYYVNDDVSMVGGRTRYFHYVEGRQQALKKQIQRAQWYLISLKTVMEPYAINRDPQRCFDTELKEQLWESNKKCAFCKNEITSFKECVVDHHLPWVEGGMTERKNARLAHRICNWLAGQNISRVKAIRGDVK
ncbi:MAG: DUF262 domain-containing protein [Euryarchaeota archaeon]|jgi:hypothetical protein|nr:DUF262 domain-containing protein [Euryarchaeota archaeon]